MVDFRRIRPPNQPVSIQGTLRVAVQTYQYLRVFMDDKLDWSPNTGALSRKGESHLFFLSYDVCMGILNLFYHTAVARALQCSVLGRLLDERKHQVTVQAA